MDKRAEVDLRLTKTFTEELGKGKNGYPIKNWRLFI